MVYWSGTGNTQAMADLVAEGAKDAGAEVTVMTSAEFSADQLGNYDKVAFGCPSMGAEELEETEFGPMFTSLEGDLKGRTIALFGSYGWGDGEWMRTWEETCRNDGAEVVGTVIANEAPDDDAAASCKDLGASLANA